jgi:hypothetical protein
MFPSKRPHCHPEIVHMNITHIMNTNTSTLENINTQKVPTPRSASGRIDSTMELQLLNRTRQALDLTYVFPPDLPVTPCEYATYEQISCKYASARKTLRSIFDIY